MDRRACQATVHGVARVRYNLVTKPSPNWIIQNWSHPCFEMIVGGPCFCMLPIFLLSNWKLWLIQCTRLKLQYFGHLMWRVDSLEKTLKLGGIGGRRRGWQRMKWEDEMASPTQRTWVCVNSGSWWWTGRPGMLQFMGLQRVGHDWVTELNFSFSW